MKTRTFSRRSMEGTSTPHRERNEPRVSSGASSGRASRPASNRTPCSLNDVTYPPGLSCFSNTATFMPAMDRNAAVLKPPIPAPTTIASKSFMLRTTS